MKQVPGNQGTLKEWNNKKEKSQITDQPETCKPKKSKDGESCGINGNLSDAPQNLSFQLYAPSENPIPTMALNLHVKMLPEQ